MNLGERYLINEACPICGKPVYADEGYHSVMKAHSLCSAKQKADEVNLIAKIDATLESLTGKKRKAVRTTRGFGKTTEKLALLIEAALKKRFETDDVTDVLVCPAPPVWCRDKYDVMRLEGSAKVNGLRVSFGSWATVSELIKYREVQFDNDWPSMGLSPVYETRRTRNNAATTNERAS